MWVKLGKLKECLESLREQRVNRIVIQIWRMTPLCVTWCLWREINVRNFEDRGVDISLKLSRYIIYCAGGDDKYKKRWIHM
jgi:hypothetical protein